MNLHVGRAWISHAIEDACPCPKAPCGLVDQQNTNPDCQHHPVGRGKTIRQGHSAAECPAEEGEHDGEMPRISPPADPTRFRRLVDPQALAGQPTPPAGEDVHQACAEAYTAAEPYNPDDPPQVPDDEWTAGIAADQQFRAAVDRAVQLTEQRMGYDLREAQRDVARLEEQRDQAWATIRRLTAERDDARDELREAREVIATLCETDSAATLAWLVQQRDRHMVGSLEWGPLDGLVREWQDAHPGDETTEPTR
jgi:hypothetical protein